MVRIATAFRVTEQQKRELTAIAQSRSLPAGYVFRAKLILLLEEGRSFSSIRERLDTTTPTIIRWKQRFLEAGVKGLDTNHPGQKPYKLTPSLRARILGQRARSRTMDRLTGAAESWRLNWASARIWFIAYGRKLASSRTGWSAIWPAMIRTLRRRQPTLSAYT